MSFGVVLFFLSVYATAFYWIWIPIFTPSWILFTSTLQVHLTAGYNELLVCFLTIAQK